MSAEVLLHVPERYLAPARPGDGTAEDDRADRIGGRKRLLYTEIVRLIEARGGRWRAAPRDAAAVGADGNLHIVDNGRGAGEGRLNAATAYLEGFWHLDPRGVLANSSIRRERFDPASVDRAEAEAWLARLRSRFVASRRSRYGQRRLAAQTFQEGAIAVFLQGPHPYRVGHAHVAALPMLVATARFAAAEGRPVIVKPHPLDREAGQEVVAAARAAGHAVIETDANVHDILAGAAVTVSVNSAASVEGFLHGVPAVLCGKSDVWAAVETARRVPEIGPSLARALAGPRDFAPFLWWYFAARCLHLDDPDLDARLLARFADVGFPAERLGLRA